MGKLAEMAGTKALTGPVTVTLASGVTQTFESEDEALASCGGASLFHHRGAFYEQGCTPRGAAPKPAPKRPAPSPVAVAEPEPAAESSGTTTKKKRRRSSGSE